MNRDQASDILDDVDEVQRLIGKNRVRFLLNKVIGRLIEVVRNLFQGVLWNKDILHEFGNTSISRWIIDDGKETRRKFDVLDILRIRSDELRVTLLVEGTIDDVQVRNDLRSDFFDRTRDGVLVDEIEAGESLVHRVWLPSRGDEWEMRVYRLGVVVVRERASENTAELATPGCIFGVSVAVSEAPSSQIVWC